MKSVSWRIVGTIDTMIISYFITGRVTIAISIGSVEVITKTILYYFHERLWAHIHKIKLNLQFKSNGKKYEVKGAEVINCPGKQLKRSWQFLSLFFQDRIIFTTSLGIEDQVITHKIFNNNLDIKVVTLDTGRLFPQTYDVLSNTIIRYNKKIDVYFPEYEAVEKMVTEKGPFSFYQSVENRKECCTIRKVVPLNRALAGMECWISGIRADQSDEPESDGLA